jgi:hypothetical protein
MTTSPKQVMLAVTIASAATFAAITVTAAAPPTAQYSPGYEARIAEARKAAQLAAQQRMIVPPTKKRHHHRSTD